MTAPSATQFGGDQDCIHGLPESQCSICSSRLPQSVWITDGGAAYHARETCEWLQKGQDYAYGLGLRTHRRRKVSRVRAESDGYMPCGACLLRLSRS
jgi:hypothetical protein